MPDLPSDMAEKGREPVLCGRLPGGTQHARWVDTPGNAICLCAEHFAKWRHAAKAPLRDVLEQIRSFQLISEGSAGDLAIEFTPLNEKVALHYDERHFIALRALVSVADTPSPEQAAGSGDIHASPVLFGVLTMEE